MAKKETNRFKTDTIFGNCLLNMGKASTSCSHMVDSHILSANNSIYWYPNLYSNELRNSSVSCDGILLCYKTVQKKLMWYSHFVVYFLITIIFPSYWIWIICVSILWEGVELFMKKVASEKTLSRTARTRIGSSGEYQYLTYWESAWEDIIINTLSILLALLIMRFFKK